MIETISLVHTVARKVGKSFMYMEAMLLYLFVQIGVFNIGDTNYFSLFLLVVTVSWHSFFVVVVVVVIIKRTNINLSYLELFSK